MSNSKLKNFLLIASYRDNEVNPLLTTALDTIRDRGTGFTCVNIGNLSLGGVQEYLAEVLELEVEEVETLAQALFAKTQGNMFYVRASLLLLEEKNCLVYSYNTYRWEWNLSRLQQELNVSENVVEVTIASLHSLPESLQNVLLIASFMRSSFDLDTLHSLVQVDGTAVSMKALQELIDKAVTFSYLEYDAGHQKYRFVHDKIRQAANCLVPTTDRSNLRVKVGRRLLTLASSPSGEDWMFFAGTDNINAAALEGEGAGDVDVLELAEINFRAGTKAVARSGYVPGSEYLQKAIELIERTAAQWTDHYAFCLSLYVCAANVDYCIGKFDRGDRSAKQVLDEAKTEREKLPAYNALAEGLGLRERHKDALEMNKKSIAIVADFPKLLLPLRMLSDMQALKSLFKSKTDEDILSLPLITDKDKIMAIDTLSKMWIRAYLSKEMVLSLLCMTRALRMTFQYGLSPPGALAFAAYGSLLCGPLEDHATGVRLGKLSYEIVELTGDKNFEARIVFTSAVHIDAWVTPLSAVQDTLYRGWKSGMAHGDTEFAFFSLAYYNIHAYLMGSSLDSIIEESTSLIAQMEQYGNESVRAIVLPFHQMLLDLAGRTQNPLSWLKATEGDGTAVRKPLDPSEHVKVIWSYFSRGQLAFFFGEMEAAHKIWSRLKPLLAGMASYSAPTMYTFFSGLIATAMYRQTGKRQFKGEAQKAVKSLNVLMKKFNTGLNNLHRFYIMKADCAATFEPRTKKDEIRAEFDQAISAASKAGFIQDAALANELCGEYFRRAEDLYWARHYLTSAHELYCLWGADAKANHLYEHRGSYLNIQDSLEPASPSARRRSTLKRGPLSSRKQFEVVTITRSGKAENQSPCESSLFLSPAVDDISTL